MKNIHGWKLADGDDFSQIIIIAVYTHKHTHTSLLSSSTPLLFDEFIPLLPLYSYIIFPSHPLCSYICLVVLAYQVKAIISQPASIIIIAKETSGRTALLSALLLCSYMLYKIAKSKI